MTSHDFVEEHTLSSRGVCVILEAFSSNKRMLGINGHFMACVIMMVARYPFYKVIKSCCHDNGGSWSWKNRHSLQVSRLEHFLG